MGNKTAQEPVIGYDWKPANKRKPRCYEVLKFRSIEDPTERLSMWDGQRFYIFNVYLTKWEPFADEDLPKWEYAYIPGEQSKYMPFHAIAVAKRSEVFGSRTKFGNF